MPNVPIALAQTCSEAQCGPFQTRCSLEEYAVARGYVSQLLGVALANVSAEQLIGVGTSSNATIASIYGMPT